LHDAAAEGASIHLGKSGWLEKVVGHPRPLSCPAVRSLRHSLLVALNTTPKLTPDAVINRGGLFEAMTDRLGPFGISAEGSGYSGKDLTISPKTFQRIGPEGPDDQQKL
jgi:hypothetical protein